MSNYANQEEVYVAVSAAYYGSIVQHVEQVALAKGFITRNGTVNLNTLAKHSGISTSTLWYMLRGKQRFRALNLVTLAKLCWTLGVQPGALFEWVPGGTSNGLGYSAEAFARLQGTRTARSDDDSPQGSDEIGDEGDSERGTLVNGYPVSGLHG